MLFLLLLLLFLFLLLLLLLFVLFCRHLVVDYHRSGIFDLYLVLISIVPKEEEIVISFITDVPNPDMLGHRLVFREKRIEKNDRFFDANLKSFVLRY